MRQNNQPVTLIEGQFSPDESLEILNSLFTAKIRFHELKNFSSLERLGQEDAVAKKKIPQLKKSLLRIQREITRARKQKRDLHLFAEISLVSAKPATNPPVKKGKTRTIPTPRAVAKTTKKRK